MAEHLLEVGEAEVVAFYLHGSAVLGGWRAQVSDVDVLVVVPEDVGPVVGLALADAAASTIPVCPGTGLELSVVARSAAAVPGAPWPFVVHVAGGG